MDVHKLERIFNPKRIALIGVTPNPQSVGGKVLANLVGGGFRGVVYPVNPDWEAVMGIPCYSGVSGLPRIPDLGVICTAAPLVPGWVDACGKAGISGIIIMSSGFKETGPEGRKLEDEIRGIQARYSGMRILGPNCLGVIAPRHNLNISFAEGMPKPGEVVFISQSGALCSSVLDWAVEEKLGFSSFVSLGNALDIDFGDLIDYFGEDEQSRSIILYIESIGNARKFMTAARAFARTKPMVVYKAGRFPESAEVAASHTGAMAAEDAVYDAAFQRAGMVRVFEIGDVFDCAELIARKKIPRGPRLAIVTNAGGPGVMAADALIAADGILAKLSEDSLNSLNDVLPPSWSHGNPVDVLGDARSKRIMKAVHIVLEDKNVDAVMIILTPQAMTNPTTTARALGELAEKTTKPVLAIWMGGVKMQEGVAELNQMGVPTYRTPEQGVHAFATLVEYARNLETLYETPRDIPVEFPLERAFLRSRFNALIAGKGEILSEDISKELLELYGIPTSRPRIASSAEDAVTAAIALGYPVVLKIHSPDITHKTDVGGVRLDLQDAGAVREAYEGIMTSARNLRPDARIHGVTVQPMINHKNAVELILGSKKDPVFGTIIMSGSGGVTAELYNDRTLGFPPLNERLARRMLEALKIFPLLKGYRGKPPLNMERLIEILIRLSYLVADYPEIRELDINPLLVGEHDVTALDARIVIDSGLVGRELKPFSHLALRPYPEEYVRSASLEDGAALLLRPIKPEDEPLWMDMLARCSRESIYARFRYFFQWTSHETATHYCYIDYDRQIAIVAEYRDGERRRLAGVGRLIADPDMETAEYAILIPDDFQNKGLGSLLTDFCMEIAEKWNIKKIVAETTTDNSRMISVFSKRGFEIRTPDNSGALVDVSKELDSKASDKDKTANPLAT